MDARQLFLTCLDSASRAIAMVSSEDYSKPTPDTEWDVRTLANHMLSELYWTSDIVRGKSILDVGGQYDGDLISNYSLSERWQEAETWAREAVSDCDLRAIAHLSSRESTNDYYLKQAAADQLIHSWDLSAALGQPVHFDEGAAEAVYENIYDKRDELTMGGLFGPEIKVSLDSDLQTRLLAIYGRDANWSPGLF